jgi:class 3 adenylate cyclase/tetratricopeptide (TPR) repeat protein
VSATGAGRERRKVVTVIFADVVGSTALGESVDPETLRWAMQRWFGRMGEAVERHGGTVERYIGDAVMAVFGTPVAHEDDALRAVRAAADMRSTARSLSAELRNERGLELSVRIGVNTGEAVTGAAVGGGFFTAGDTVNVAARLEQAARPADILLGRDTYRMVRHAVDVQPVDPLMVKGKREALEAFRLLAVVSGARGRPDRPQAPMMGRQRERRRVLDAFHQAVADRSCQLLTVLGPAGVGKSRLVAEVLETIDGAATVAAGRCLPYGDGLTWWPLVEALGDTGLLDRVSDEPAAIRVAQLLEVAGEPLAPEEAYWAVRKVLEALARRRPLVLVVDDLQWGEPPFVDLIEHVADWARNAPLLLLIMARPELLDVRPAWGGGKLNATTLLLEPLADADAAGLLAHLVGPVRLDDTTVARILAIAEGNPLFVEEVVAMLMDDGVLPSGGGARSDVLELSAIAVPTTIQALITSRLDRLGPGERAVIEAASIEGVEFGRERVEALMADASDEPVDEHVRTLIRKDLIRPADASEDTLRFRHQLIRDGAYGAIPKEVRAGLHERFANWLCARAAAMPGADELLGYHLESAVLLRRELGGTGGDTAELAARASRHLRAAGRRATQRQEPACVRLLERALELAPDPDRGPILFELADALETVGDVLRAADVAASAVDVARAAGDRRTAARASVVGLRLGMARSTADIASLEATARSLLAELEALGDDEGIASALLLLGELNNERFEAASSYFERAVAAAERTGDRKTAAIAASGLGLITVFGPVAAADGIERCRALRQRFADNPGTSAVLLRDEAVLHAMQGRIDEARALVGKADRVIEDLGSRWLSASAVFGKWMVEVLAGEPERAESAARASVELLHAMGALSQGSTAAALLAWSLARRGCHDEALHFADLAAAWAAPDDMASQTGQLAARALVLAARGDIERAEQAARTAIRFVEPTDEISLHGDCLVTLATVLDRAGRAAEAVVALREAIALYERKGNMVATARARATLDGIEREVGVVES